MRNYLVVATDFDGSQRAAEYLDRVIAIQIAGRTFRSARNVKSVRVEDRNGHIIYQRLVSSRFKE